ncbi:dsRBD fold-containing protein [Streptantibioticus parmotrematis]|uniref:dsRBD fold-containing protein n=1 Tax=Streptantibioticus parmotrematis TaxID=2873249 RepID=UPI0033C8A566
MTSPAGASGPVRTKEWKLSIRLFEEPGLTRTHVVLDTGDTVLESIAEAHRSPHAPLAAGISDEIAAGRALMDLGEQLVGAGAADAQAVAADARRDG